MKKIFISALAIMLSLCSYLSASEDMSSAKGTGTAVHRAREMVLSYFRPVEGTITDVRGPAVSVKFREGADVRKGMRLSVFRQGSPFFHPVTSELIGYTEEFAGRIEVSGDAASDGAYPCAVMRGELKPGDTVRVSESKIRLAFFQERKSDWELSEAFYGSLKESGRFEILESYTSSYDPADLSKLAMNMKAEAFLLFSTPTKNEEKFMNVTLYWAEDARLFAKTEELVGLAGMNMLAPQEEFIVRSLSDTEPWGSYRLASGQFFSMGDVDGNGAVELVVSDGNAISIYNFREQLQEMWQIKGKATDNHLSIDVLDLNGNGRAEIFVTSLSGDTNMKPDDTILGTKRSGGIAVESFVLEYDPAEGYKKIAEGIPYFFRVSGKKLLMQKFDENRIFSGPVYEGEWTGEAYAGKGQLTLPPDVSIYGFTFVDWQNKGQDMVMTFDDAGNLLLYDSRGHALWKSSRSYGKSPFSYERTTNSIANPLKKWSLRGRLISIRTGGAEEVIVVNRMSVVDKIPGLGSKGAEVYSLRWDGIEMQEKLILSEVPGTVTDHWVQGSELYLLAKGDIMTFVKSAVTGEFVRGSMLYYYKLGEK